MTDPHDPREFRQWVTLDDSGSAVLAVHEVVASVEQPLPTVVEVTDLGPQDWATVAPEILASLRATATALRAKGHAKKAAAALTQESVPRTGVTTIA